MDAVEWHAYLRRKFKEPTKSAERAQWCFRRNSWTATFFVLSLPNLFPPEREVDAKRVRKEGVKKAKWTTADDSTRNYFIIMSADGANHINNEHKSAAVTTPAHYW